MKTTKIKLILAGLLALFALSWGELHLHGDLWLAIAPSGTNALLSWSNSAASLEQSLTVTGAWTAVEGANSPYVVPVTNDASFYRLRLPTGGPFDFRYLAPTFTTGIGDPSGGCGCTSPENPNSLSTAGSLQDNGLGSVFLHTGELTQHAVDLAIPGRGFDWKFERRYRSGVQYDGPLGQGWDFNYNQRLAVQANGDVLRVDGLGRADRYVWTGATYQSPSGFYTRLVRNLDGTFDERDRHGTVDTYSATNTLGIARLTRIRDRNTNQMTFAYSTLGQLTNVLDTLGRSIAYSYDVNGRLTQVSDFIGRTLQFGYDTDGNLASVTSPAVTGTPNGNDFPLGKTTRYTYSSGFGDGRFNHNLLTVTAANEVAVGGPPRLVVQYDTNPASTNADRVVSLMLGGTNASGVGAGGTIAYTYDSFGTAPANDFNTAVFAATITNRNGNVAEYRFNQLGNIVRQTQFTRGLRPGDPPGYTNQFEFNRDGEITRRTNPAGDSVENTYDNANPDRFQQGNLLQARRLPGPRGADQTQLVTTYTYEPLFNQVRTTTEPCGNDPAYVPPNGGANSPGRYTRTNFYDYQESAATPAEATAWGITIPPALLGLGDLNDDGTTSQAHGNLVRRTDPTVNLLPGSNQAIAEGGTQQEIVTRYTYNQFGQLTQTEDARGNMTTYAYFAENDPDGDGQDVIAGRDSTTGGYLALTVKDAFIGPRRLDPLPVVAITNSFKRDRVGNLTSLTDGRGNSTTFTYNALDQMVQEEQPKVDAGQSTGYLRRYSYDANNNRVGLDIQNVTTDPTDHLPVLVASHPFLQHRYTYDILDRLVEQVQDATRDPAVSPSSQPELLTTRYRYDANGNRAREISPLAVSGAEPDNSQSFTSDERDLRSSVTRGGALAQASTWTYAYDRNGNLARWTDAEDNDATPGPESEVTTYDGFDRRRSVVDRAGNEQRFTYDPAGRTAREEFFGPTTAGSSTNVLLRSVSCGYDELGRLFQVDRPLFVPAGVSLHTNVALADGPLTPGDMTVSRRYEYDANSRPTFEVQDNGAVSQQVYDGAGRLISKVLPQVDTVTPGGPYPTRSDFTYDANGNLVRKTDTLSNPHGIAPPQVVTRLMVYDALNRRVRETDPDGHTSYTEFDSLDNQVSAYDARGPLISDPLGLYTSGTINDRGNATRSAYDGLGRPWQRMIELTTTGEGGDPLNTTNTYNPDGLITLGTIFDANSRLVSRTDDNGNTQRYAYDALNRQVAITNADGGWRAWTFDRDDNAIALRDENNTVHTFTYDGLDRLRAHALIPDATKTNAAGLPLLVGTTLQTFDYDGLSRLVRSFDNNDPATTNDDWTATQAYDSLGRVLEDNQNGRAVNSGYTAEDRTTLYYPNGRVVHRAFDGLNQLVHLANQDTLGVGIEMQGSCPCPRPLQCAFSIPVVGLLATDSRSFSNEGLVTGIQQTCGSNTVDNFFFSRSRENDVVGSQRFASLGALFYGEFQTHAYDSAQRETSFTSVTNTPFAGGSVIIQTIFDGAQNGRQLLDAQGNVLQIMNVNPVNELQGDSLKYGSSPSTGIRTRDSNFIYQWDGLNRLRVLRQRAVPGNIVAVYTYDGQPAIQGGRRVQKTVSNSGDLNGTTRFYYDGANAIEETTVNGGNEQVARQFIFGTGPDEVFAMDADTNGDGTPDALFFYLRDHNNNNTQLLAATDSNAAPYERYSYNFRGAAAVFDAGTLTNRLFSAAGNPYLFTGQRYEAETGLYYYKARYYDPYYGVFLSRDPLGFWGDERGQGNPTAYAGNNPWNVRDPSGLKLCVQGAAADAANMRSALAQLCPEIGWDPKTGCVTGGGMVDDHGVIKAPTTDQSGNGGSSPVRYQHGCRLLWDLIIHQRMVIVQAGGPSKCDRNFAKACTTGTDATVTFNPNDPMLTSAAVHLLDIQGYIALGHELWHALHAVTGTMKSGHVITTEGGTTLAVDEEIATVMEENEIRHEHGLAQRTKYSDTIGIPKDQLEAQRKRWEGK